MLVDVDVRGGPDVAVVHRNRLPPAAEQDGYLERAPDLAVEIVSPSDRWTSVTEKVDAYLAAGVALVWVVEPMRRAVHVYAREGTQRRLRADRDDALDGGDVLPGFRLPLAELLAALA